MTTIVGEGRPSSPMLEKKGTDRSLSIHPLGISGKGMVRGLQQYNVCNIGENNSNIQI